MTSTCSSTGFEAVAIQIQTRINGRRVRRTKQLVEIVVVDPQPSNHEWKLFKWDPARDDFDFSGKSYVLEKIMVKINFSQEKDATRVANS